MVKLKTPVFSRKCLVAALRKWWSDPQLIEINEKNLIDFKGFWLKPQVPFYLALCSRARIKATRKSCIWLYLPKT